MQFTRPIVMTIAGFDPSGGAGILADIKTLEQQEVYGLAVSTAQTIQTEGSFYSVRWESEADILEGVVRMLSNYSVRVIKLGIIQNIDVLLKVVDTIRSFGSGIQIVLDPVLRSSTGFDFWSARTEKQTLEKVLGAITLITPNCNEALQLMPAEDAKESGRALSKYCAVLLKGGHNIEEPGVDYLYYNDQAIRLDPDIITLFPKHGSGCVLSSAIAGQLALGEDLVSACRKAKLFTERFLMSNTSLLGYYV